MTRDPRSKPTLQTAAIVANAKLCREHFRLSCHVSECVGAYAGQFVHLGPGLDDPPSRHCADDEHEAASGGRKGMTQAEFPMLRRAFSIAGLRRTGDGVAVDVIYRVVGRGTRWMSSLGSGDQISLLGPLGKGFPISANKPRAWMVAGGVGLPPMLWLAEVLQTAGKQSTAFLGAQRSDLFPVTLDPVVRAERDAGQATFCCRELAAHDTASILSTDDGSLGFAGHVGDAMRAFHEANPVAAEELVVYTCGPDRMLRFVAQWCAEQGVECYVCLERAMACGTGLCQSCVVPVVDDADPEGWRYQLCCSDGPVFDASTIRWDL